jgi:hypothetical protein
LALLHLSKEAAKEYAQVSLSKTPRLEAHGFIPALVRRGVSDEG